ncbi:hypothetical protein LguiB_000896 [Lonicera macranthoides]
MAEILMFQIASTDIVVPCASVWIRECDYCSCKGLDVGSNFKCHGKLHRSSDVRRYSHLFIDCGALTQNNVSDQSIVKWQTDEQFIKKGENKLLPSNTASIELTTLRFFPEGNKNCYKLPFYNSYRKYIFRATFYYGNYDGLSKPPSFGLEFNGKLWANVTTSTSEEPVIYELIYIIKKDEAEVCLVRTNEDDTPFISSLEAIVAYDAYNMMDNNTALYLHSRINYGANASVE